MTVILLPTIHSSRHLLDDPDLLRPGHLHLDCHHRAHRPLPGSRHLGLGQGHLGHSRDRAAILGRLVYLIVYHAGLAERSDTAASASQAQFHDYVRQIASRGGAASEIEKAKQMITSGAITQAEFDAINAKAIASTTTA